MRHYWKVLLLLSLPAWTAQAQEPARFSRLIDYQGLWQDAIAVKELPNGNYLVVGRTLGGSITDNKIFMVWLSPQGDTVQTRTHQVENMGHWLTRGGLHIYPDGSYVLGGSLSDETLGISDYFLARFNEEGDTAWFRRYEAPLYDICRSMRPTPDGGFALAGFSRSFGDPNFGNFHLMKTDSMGHVEWRKSFGQNGVTEDASFLALTPEGDYILTGLKGPFGSTEIRVMRISGSGNLMWQKTFGGAANSDNYPTIIPLQDGNFLLIGTTGYNLNKNAYLAKIDGMGNLLWEKNYPNEFNTFLSLGLETAQGDLVVVGQTYFYNPDVPIYYQKSNISKLTADGEEIWKRYHYTRDDRNNYLYDIVKTSDGGFVSAGFARSDTSDTSDFWVVKTDSFGCLVAGCELVSAVEGHPDSGAAVEIKVYPNPFSSEATVEYRLGRALEGMLYLEVFDNMGRLHIRQIVPGQPGRHVVPLYGEHLPAGIFHIILSNGSGILARQAAVRSR